MATGVVGERWRVAPGERVDLAAIKTASKAGAPGGRKQTEEASDALRDRLAELQNRLWAENEHGLLVVFQAMDGGGKDGAIRKVFSGVNPQGCRVRSFKAPTGEELDHDFLWRIHPHAPAKGEIAIFNRSHYEDVLIVRVHDLVPPAVWKARYGVIRDFERNLAGAGTRIVKFMLHISRTEQAQRFEARLADPAKRWKFNHADLDERRRWDDYMAAYSDAISETATEDAPWYVVPADRKWYRDWVVLSVLVGTLEEMNPQFPEPDLTLVR